MQRFDTLNPEEYRETHKYYQIIPKSLVDLEPARKTLAKREFELIVLVDLVILIVSVIIRYSFPSRWSLLLYYSCWVIAVLSFIGTAIHSINLYHSADRYSKNIRKLDWYIGENDKYFFVLNMDMIDVEEYPVIMSSLAQSSPVVKTFMQKRKSAKPHVKSLMDAALNEICYEQHKIKNEQFFTSDDYFRHYQE